ncbi:MAG: hypothetical protein OXU51_00745, partial [Candidatus Poribacteria bacterium]|nr:hypothetical protein [Candidatus Poribacteria bacterium]
NRTVYEAEAPRFSVWVVSPITYRSAGAEDLKPAYAIDISLRWSERSHFAIVGHQRNRAKLVNLVSPQDRWTAQMRMTEQQVVNKIFYYKKTTRLLTSRSFH